MIDALEDYHTCTVCSRPVHDYGPDADAINVRGQWFHRLCQKEVDATRKSLRAGAEAQRVK